MGMVSYGMQWRMRRIFTDKEGQRLQTEKTARTKEKRWKYREQMRKRQFAVVLGFLGWEQEKILQREPGAILWWTFKISQRNGFNLEGIRESLKVFKERHDIECYYLRTGRNLRDGPSSSFTVKGTERRGDLVKVHPELEARSLDLHTAQYSLRWLSPLCQSINYIWLCGT